MAQAPSYGEWLAQNGISYTDPAQGQKDYAAAMTQYADPSDLSSLPQGFLQSEYAPDYLKVLQNYSGNYDRQNDPNGYGALLKNWLRSYSGGRSYADWQHIASQSAQGAIEPDIAQAALGGAAGVLYGAGVGAGGIAGGAGSGASGGVLEAGTGAGAGATAGVAGGGAAPTLGQVGGVLSGGAAVTNALNGGGGAPAAQGAAGGPNTGGIIGALLGGGLGALQGGNRPAGTTTTTTNQTLAPGGLQQLQNTISGQYLDPATNPYLNQTYDAAARQITPRVNSLFEASGRYGSGAHQGVLGQTLSDLGTSIYGGNYNAERQRQLAAAGTPIGNTVQNPYFTNPLGGALSGALAGGVLGGGTNFLGGTNGGILNGIGGTLGNIFGSGTSGTSGTSDQTNNWNPSMPLPDYYGASPAAPANASYNSPSYLDPSYGFRPGGQAPIPISIDQYTRTPM